MSLPANLVSSDLGKGNLAELKVDSLRAGIVFAIALTLAQRVVGLVRGILFCRLLPEEDLGVWSLTWSYLMLLPPLAVLGLPGCFNRYIETYRQRGQLRSFLFRATAISLFTTVLFSTVLFSGSSWFARLMYRDAAQGGLVMLVAALLVLVVAFNFASSLMEALRQVRLVTTMRVINGVGFTVIALGMLCLWRTDAFAVTTGFLVSCVAGTIPACWFLMRNWTVIDSARIPLGHTDMWKRIGPFAAWLWVSNILTNVYESIDRTMLLYLARAELPEIQAMIGQCHSGRLIPQVLTGVAAMLGGTLMAYLTAHWEQGEMDKVKRQLSWTMKLISIGFTFVSLVALAVAPFLFEQILHGKYADGLAIMPLMFASCIWFSLMTVGQDWLWCRESGKWACVALCSGLVANVALNFWLIPAFGLWGAVWGTAISSLFALLVLLAISARFGWRADAGVIATSLFPLVLLLPWGTATVVAIVIAWGGLNYGWLFNGQERSELSQFFSGIMQRLQSGQQA